MMDLKDFIYDFNLVSTLTASDIHESCFVINNGRKKEINYSDCVSLYDVVERFNKGYLDFFRESSPIKDITCALGEDASYAFHSVSDDFASLCLDVSKPDSSVFDDNYAAVYLVNNRGDYYAFADNGRRRSDEKYKSCRVLLDYGAVVNGLDIVKKNNLFLDSYKDLKNKFVFGNGCTVLFSKVEGDLFDRLTIFTLTFGNSYMNREDFVEVKFRLGDNLEILYDESKVVIGDEEITDVDRKKKIIKELLSSIYVNSDKLNRLYKNNDSDEKVHVKGDN